MEKETIKYKCEGCGKDRPCFVETNQEKSNFNDFAIEELKCILDETNRTSYNWERIETPPNLDNLLELAREEGKKYAYHNIHQELEYIGFVRGITFIIDKLKELGK